LGGSLFFTAPAAEVFAGQPPDPCVDPANHVNFQVISGLDFGSVLAGTTAGTVVIDYKGTSPPPTTGGVTWLTSTISVLHLWSETIDNVTLAPINCSNNSMIVDINFGSAVTLTGPGTNMTVDTWDISTKPANPSTKYNSGDIYIGGTLHVNANQAPGSYTGTFSVTQTIQ